MPPTLSETKLLVQQAIGDRTVTVIGSGLSAAAGLPTMPQLADLLLKNMPVDRSLASDWKPIADRLKTQDLESAMDGISAGSPILSDVVKLVSAEVTKKERDVFDNLAKGEALPLARLFTLLARVNSRIVVVTTNYDRLVEAASEQAGLPIDTSFTGAYFGRFDPETSRQLFESLPRQRDRRTAIATRQHVALLKPHGSLDWFRVGDEPIRSITGIDSPPLIITPGSSKYETGYERPFDHHRAAGNAAIDAARALLIVGYGFNDSHLQTHLGPALNSGTSAVVLARTLSVAAHAQLASAPQILAMERTAGAAGRSTTVYHHGESAVYDGVDLWDLEVLIAEALI